MKTINLKHLNLWIALGVVLAACSAKTSGSGEGLPGADLVEISIEDGQASSPQIDQFNGSYAGPVQAKVSTEQSSCNSNIVLADKGSEIELTSFKYKCTDDVEVENEEPIVFKVGDLTEVGYDLLFNGNKVGSLSKDRTAFKIVAPMQGTELSLDLLVQNSNLFIRLHSLKMSGQLLFEIKDQTISKN